MASEDQERQIAELTLLSSMFPDEFRWHYPVSGAIDLSSAPASDFEVSLALDGA